MSNSWDEMGKAKEGSYFDKKNREALERLAKKQEAEKPRISPVSGKPMEQVVLNGVVIDRCAESGGVWLDAGELEQLIHASQDEKNSLAGIFRELAGLKK